MLVIIVALLLFAFVLVPGLCLLGVLHDLVEHNVQDGPTIHDTDPVSQGARSQFAWQSRSHSRAPD
jgi:hypothetical protein